MKIQYKSPEKFKSSDNERQSLQSQNFFAPPLNDRFYAESYELRKATSTMTVSAIDWFRNNVTVLLGADYSLSHQ
ncbi:hypothetical protein [Okeania sp.]|uniref:hypothetical protein n=1 Tax=Okeania sp. TaxID=3100323 RepID=UPI002B4B78D7|nr:hypothetical protein [Okeania sp.]MEB3340174.1 hypothetical protein [Okeania sp.]